MRLDFIALSPSIPFLISGVFITLQYAILSVFLGLIWGVFLALMKISKINIMTVLANGYTAIFRGTPLLVQLMLIYYGTPQLTGYKISAYEAGILTFSLNSGAYISEVIRAGIRSLDHGQFEAFESLGISYYAGMRDIILPQAFKNSLPAIINEMIDMIKESSIISFIGEMDLLRRAQIVAAEKYIYFEPYIIVAAVYFIIIKILAMVASRIELWMARYDQH